MPIASRPEHLAEILARAPLIEAQTAACQMHAHLTVSAAPARSSGRPRLIGSTPANLRVQDVPERPNTPTIYSIVVVALRPPTAQPQAFFGDAALELGIGPCGAIMASVDSAVPRLIQGGSAAAAAERNDERHGEEWKKMLHG